MVCGLKLRCLGCGSVRALGRTGSRRGEGKGEGEPGGRRKSEGREEDRRSTALPVVSRHVACWLGLDRFRASKCGRGEAALWVPGIVDFRRGSIAEFEMSF